jgi:hypothetical protein
MPLQFLDAGSFDQVRACLDLSLDAASLPDELIAQPVYAPDAEAEVLERDVNAATYADGTVAKQRATNAAVFLTAARLAPSLPAIASEKLGDWQMSQTPPDLAKLAASLRGMAARQISLNVNGTTSAPLPSFGLAKAGCGRRWRG